MAGYLLFAVLVMAVAYGLFRLWRRGIDRDIAVGAADEYAHLRRTDPALMEGLDETRFRSIYGAVNTPRFPAYLLVAMAAFFLGSPIVLGLLSAGAYFGVETGIVPQPGAAATELYFNADGASLVRRVSPEALSYILQGWAGFYYFFGLLIFWLGVVFVTMRRYHQKTPGSLRDEILRHR